MRPSDSRAGVVGTKSKWRCDGGGAAGVRDGIGVERKL